MQIKLHIAERFINWYPHNTKLYIRGERSWKSYSETLVAQSELCKQLAIFFDAFEKEIREDERKKIKQESEGVPIV